jgi:hypothetical protein
MSSCRDSGSARRISTATIFAALGGMLLIVASTVMGPFISHHRLTRPLIMIRGVHRVRDTQDGVNDFPATVPEVTLLMAHLVDQCQAAPIDRIGTTGR